MNETITLSVVCFLYALIGLEAVLAYKSKIFSPNQMVKAGHKYGIPWIGHFGASWGDIFIVTPLVYNMIAVYGNQWILSQHWILITCTSIVTVIFHIIWMKNKLPDCLAWNGKLEPAGYPHCLYMMVVLPVIILFYFYTNNVDPLFLKTVSILLGIHILIGNHVIISLLKPNWWQINTLRDPVTVVTILGVWFLLGWRTYNLLLSK